MELTKEEKGKKRISGITLIALVLTIIVLLILAGVSISMLTGENGILKQAQLAKKLTEVSSEKEGVQLIMQMHYLDENNERYDIGTKLYDRNITNGNKWSIIMIKDTKETYGNDWRYIPKGTNLLDYGEAKYNWLYNEETGEAIQLEEDSFIELAYGANLAVKDGLVFNLDPLNMENSDSWGDAILYGFNGVEKDEDGNVISGFSGEDFNFDGEDDYIEIYSDSDFSQEGITIETYGCILEDMWGLAGFYKGPVEGSRYAFKYMVGNMLLDHTNESRCFQIAGTFFQGIETGTQYQCLLYKNDFHIPIKNDVYYGDAYVTFSLKDDGSFFVMLDGEKVAEDKFNPEYVEHYKEYLSNKAYPIIIGKSTNADIFTCRKLKTYAIRLYNKALSEGEVIDNYEKTVAYRELLNNN